MSPYVEAAFKLADRLGLRAEGCIAGEKESEAFDDLCELIEAADRASMHPDDYVLVARLKEAVRKVGP